MLEEFDSEDELFSENKTIVTSRSKYENNLQEDFIDRSLLIYDDRYSYLNRTCREDIKSRTNTRNILLMYNSYIPVRKLKGKIDSVICKRTKNDPETEIYYCMKFETDPVTFYHYERTYVLILAKKAFKSNPSNFNVDHYYPTIMRIIDSRDVNRVKVFMLSGNYFEEDREKMEQMSKMYPESIINKKPNSGNSKIIVRKKSRFENTEDDGNRTIISDDPNNLFFQNCQVDNNSISSVSENTPLTHSINSLIKENMSCYVEKMEQQNRKINLLHNGIKNIKNINKELNGITNDVKEKMDELDETQLQIRERVEMIDNKNVEISEKIIFIDDKIENMSLKLDKFQDLILNAKTKNEMDEISLLKKEVEFLKSLLMKKEN